MANNYLLTSTIYPLNGLTEEDAEAAILLAQTKQAKELGWDDPEDVSLGIYTFEPEGIWFRHDESADAECIAEAISIMQVKSGATKPFIFSYCYECSKARPDEFGGGAVAIMPDGEILWVDAVGEVTAMAEEKMKK